MARHSPHRQEAEQFAEESRQAELGQLAEAPAARPFAALCDDRVRPFHDRVLFWPRQSGPRDDLVDDEMGRVLQVPGWSNIFNQPIINRIEMLSTGVRTDVGVKVFGPDLETVDRVCKQVEAVLKPTAGARLLISDEVVDLFLPVRFYWVRRSRWLRLQRPAAARGA